MNRAILRRLLATASLAALPCSAWAEVMDKEPTVLQLWGTGVLFGIAGFLAWRRHVVAGLVAIAAAAIFVWSFHWELTDPYVGPDIVREAGQGYVMQAYGSMLVCLVLHLAGIAALVRRRVTERRKGSLKHRAVEQ